jgi:hypothetical protein
MIKEIKMRFKTKIVILLVAVLLTVLSFNVVAAEYTEIKVVTSSMTEAENEPSKGCC